MCGWVGVAVAVGGSVIPTCNHPQHGICVKVFSQEMTRYDNCCSRDKRKIYTTQFKKVDTHELAVHILGYIYD